MQAAYSRYREEELEKKSEIELKKAKIYNPKKLIEKWVNEKKAVRIVVIDSAPRVKLFLKVLQCIDLGRVFRIK